MVKLAYGLDEAAEMTSQSKDTLAIANRRGELIKSYANSKPVYTHKELERWLDTLPSEPKKSPKK